MIDRVWVALKGCLYSAVWATLAATYRGVPKFSGKSNRGLEFGKDYVPRRGWVWRSNENKNSRAAQGCVVGLRADKGRRLVLPSLLVLLLVILVLLVLLLLLAGCLSLTGLWCLVEGSR